jgi:hypothetical protein
MAIHRGIFSPGLPKGEIEDCGKFCVWWYTQPVRGKSDEKRWAFALRSECGTFWRTSACKSGFESREAAFAAGTEATKE